MNFNRAVYLKRPSGDAVWVYPEKGRSLEEMAYDVLPREERPAHWDKIRLHQDLSLENTWTVWIIPPVSTMCMGYLGRVRERSTGEVYEHISVWIEEDDRIVYRKHFYYMYDTFSGYDILYPCEEVITYHADGSLWREDSFEIPRRTRSVSSERVLPMKWSELQEEWEFQLDRLRQWMTSGWMDGEQEEEYEQEEE